ncbi:MAG: HD domain-containing protein [Patescibacteria group bacterium]
MEENKPNEISTNQKVTNFIFEVGILTKTPRSGFHFLGTGNQSVAEHINRVSFIGYCLAMMDGTVDVSKVMKMCLFHDIGESRVSDLNYVHQKYVDRKEHEAVKDISDSLPFGQDMFQTIEEYEARQSPESILVKDADNLEWAFSLKEQVDAGNIRALEWMTKAIERLKTPQALAIAEEMVNTDSNDWWFDKDSDWWVNRNKK